MSTNGNLVQVSSPSRPWLDDYEMAKTEPFTYTARDGLNFMDILLCQLIIKKELKYHLLFTRMVDLMLEIIWLQS